ncbi:hypothetical protein ACWDZ6_21265 [Streptomyces sp. NPDC002926]
MDSHLEKRSGQRLRVSSTTANGRTTLPAIVLGIIGGAVAGMLYWLSIGVLLLVADVGYLSVRSALRSRRRPTH